MFFCLNFYGLFRYMQLSFMDLLSINYAKINSEFSTYVMTNERDVGKLYFKRRLSTYLFNKIIGQLIQCCTNGPRARLAFRVYLALFELKYGAPARGSHMTQVSTQKLARGLTIFTLFVKSLIVSSDKSYLLVICDK